MRMRSRDAFPPKGWKFTQPETAWHEPKHASFNALVTALIRHRRGNPHLIEKHNWATDFEQVAMEVEEFNAVRCRNNGWFEFIQQENAPSPKLFLSRGERQGQQGVNPVGGTSREKEQTPRPNVVHEDIATKCVEVAVKERLGAGFESVISSLLLLSVALPLAHA